MPEPAAPEQPRVTTRQVASGFGWIALCNYANRILGLLSTLILAKLLTPADFGLVAIAAMMLEVIQLLKDMGLSEAVIYSKREDRAAIDTAHTILVGYNVVLVLLAVVAAPFVARFYENPTVMPVIVLMASNLVLNSLRAVPLTLVRKNLDYQSLVIPDVVPVTVASVLSIAMAFAGFGVWSLVAKSIVQSLLAMALTHYLLPFRPRFAFDREAAVELLKYGKFVAGTSVMLVALYNLDKFYVSKIGGIAALGVFQLAITIAEMPVKQISFLVGAVMFPAFSKMERTGPALRAVFMKTLKYTASVTLPVSAGLAVFGPPLLARLYGERWQGLGIALQILALYAGLRSLSSIIYDLFKATGNPRLMQHFSLFKLVMVAALGAPAIYRFGVPGIAALLAVTYTAALCWELVHLARILEISYASLVRLLLKPLLVAATVIPGAGAITGVLTGTVPLWQLGAGIALASVAYVVTLYAVDADLSLDIKSLRASRAASAHVR